MYSVLGVWGVAIVYRRGAESEEDREKAYNLEQVLYVGKRAGERGRQCLPSSPHSDLLSVGQTVVKLMRSLLMAMMQQAHKVELFKKTRGRADALHAKYSISEWTSRALCVLGRRKGGVRGREEGWGEGEGGGMG